MSWPAITGWRRLVVLWGLGGILLLLGQAIVRLAHWTVEAVVEGMEPWQWAICGVWVLFQLYAEGHRGFHLRFSPRVVSRAYYLARHPRPLHVAFAPFYCMSLFHASRRGRIVSWTLVIVIVCLVILIRHAPQPWRGIVDAGVVAGLLWGAGSVVLHWVRAWRRDPGLPPDLPGETPTAASASIP